MKLSTKIIVFIIVLISIPVTTWYLIVQPTFVKNTKDFSGDLSEKNLMNHVKALSHTLPARSYEKDNLNSSAEYIFNELKKYSNNVRYQNYTVGTNEYKNVVVTFGPDNNNELYVVGAHYDSFDGLPGADDNASGVAGVIELARLFSINPPPRTVELVAFSLEEPPYFRTENMGSYVHAKSMLNKSLDVKLMISLEMIGYYTTEPNSQEYPVSFMKYFYPTVGDFIAVVGGINELEQTRFFKENMRSNTPLPVYSINAPSLIPGVDFSDHLNYWLFDYPAIMITDTSFYRNYNYHTENDTWDKLDYKKMAMVVHGVYGSLLNYMKNN